ncbi:MAG TPA: PIN domain-containing protein [Kofleriaceae bacterium]
MKRRFTAREDAPPWPGRAVDTSVLVAAFGEWHPRHDMAQAALEASDTLVSHTLLEAYSVLTRMPPPYRASGADVNAFLQAASTKRTLLSLPAGAQREHLQRCAALKLRGGAIYDGLIGATCAHAKALLVTLDKRARHTYAALGAEYQLL